MRRQQNIGLHDLVEGFLFSLRAEGKSRSTIDYYTYLLHPLLSYAKLHDWLDDILSLDTQHVREFLNWIGTRTYEKKIPHKNDKVIQNARPVTAWPYFRVLRRLFNWAVDEGYLESSPVSTIRFKAPSEPPIEGYSREELQRLLAVCELDIKTGARFTGSRNKAMLLLFIDSGIRRAEMANLRLSDIDLDGKRLHVIGKGNKIGIAPFSAKTAKVLWNWLMVRKSRAKTDRLWVTEEGKPSSS